MIDGRQTLALVALMSGLAASGCVFVHLYILAVLCASSCAHSLTLVKCHITIL